MWSVCPTGIECMKEKGKYKCSLLLIDQRPQPREGMLLEDYQSHQTPHSAILILIVDASQGL